MKILGVVGDCNWLDYGGFIVFIPSGISEESLHTVEAIHVEPNPEDESKGWSNHFLVERMKLVGDVASKQDCLVSFNYSNEWEGSPAERLEWYDDKELDSLLSQHQLTRDEFNAAITSEDMMRVAYAYEIIGSHWGYHELSGGYEETIRLAEYRKRYALPCWRARKRGVTVYV